MKKTILTFTLAILTITGWCFKTSIAKHQQSFKFPSGNIFSYFNAHRSGHLSITLMWRTIPASHIISYQIEKSYDGEFFDPVAGQPAIHSTNSIWTDNNVFPGFIYYRIAATLSNGDVVYSDVQMVHIRQR